VVSDREVRGALALGAGCIVASLAIVAAIYAFGLRARPEGAR